MAVPNVRQQVESKLDQLSDEELTAILRYIEAMQTTSLPEDYDEANDPTVGMFSGPTDLSRRARHILYDEITARSGWTQKKD
ncbi:MAG: hypothetical protein ABI700_29550 [Chloroflexota bacterium]